MDIFSIKHLTSAKRDDPKDEPQVDQNFFEKVLIACGERFVAIVRSIREKTGIFDKIPLSVVIRGNDCVQ